MAAGRATTLAAVARTKCHAVGLSCAAVYAIRLWCNSRIWATTKTRWDDVQRERLLANCQHRAGMIGRADRQRCAQQCVHWHGFPELQRSARWRGCYFSPAQLAVSPNAPAIGTLNIQTSKGGYAKLNFEGPGARHGLDVICALLLPFGSLALVRRRRQFADLRVLGIFVVLVAFSGLMVGCSKSNMIATPAGTSNVTITATSGSITQTSIVAVTVQ